jgi:hypothetical protein
MGLQVIDAEVPPQAIAAELGQASDPGSRASWRAAAARWRTPAWRRGPSGALIAECIVDHEPLAWPRLSLAQFRLLLHQGRPLGWQRGWATMPGDLPPGYHRFVWLPPPRSE